MCSVFVGANWFWKNKIHHIICCEGGKREIVPRMTRVRCGFLIAFVVGHVAVAAVNAVFFPEAARFSTLQYFGIGLLRTFATLIFSLPLVCVILFQFRTEAHWQRKFVFGLALGILLPLAIDHLSQLR
jgi:hypothetical protein